METQASDGVPMHHFLYGYGSRPADLPTADVVAHEIDARSKALMAMRTADPMPAYGGPVLFDARASAAVDRANDAAFHFRLASTAIDAADV